MADSAQLATKNLQLAFNALQVALVELRLLLNASKTKFMVFTRDNLAIISSSGSSIERVSEYRYLGIWLDEKLSFKFHIENLITKLRQKIGFLYRNKACFPASCKKSIIEATFLSVLDYGDIIYRIASPSILKRLVVSFYF